MPHPGVSLAHGFSEGDHFSCLAITHSQIRRRETEQSNGDRALLSQRTEFFWRVSFLPDQPDHSAAKRAVERGTMMVILMAVIAVGRRRWSG
mmetsp:Transcript_21055/g.41730  ORF Transcript_21055/g.41730 Transcript_21055/m.41730 type:complete len:92 (-) Transcript_21055:173-448(-)